MKLEIVADSRCGNRRESGFFRKSVRERVVLSLERGNFAVYSVRRASFAPASWRGRNETESTRSSEAEGNVLECRE